MITIEVLISLLILSMVIATSSVTIKQLMTIGKQQKKHELLYIAVLNIKDLIDDDICRTSLSTEGDFNSFHFSAKCEEQNRRRSYVKADPDDPREGNIGQLLLILYKVTLTLKNDKIEKNYEYYKTILKKQ
jgi:hypothetical protein